MIISEVIKNEKIKENEAAEEQIIAGNLPQAAAILMDIIDSDPKNSRAYNNLGVIAWEMENWYDALGLFKEALKQKPDYADAASNLFNVALKLHKINEVRDIIIKCSDLLPYDEDMEDLGTALREDGDDIYYCGRGLQHGYYHPNIEKADSLVEQGEYDEATLLYLDMLEKEGDIAECYNGLGVIAFYRKNHSDAFTLFVEALKFNPVNRDYFLNLFDVAQIIDRVDDALKVFYACKEHYPLLEELEKMLLEYK